METKEKITKIKEILDEKIAYENAISILNWDLETEAPKQAVDGISKTISFLSGKSYSTVINDEFKNLVYSINVEELDEIDKKLIEVVKKDTFETLEKIPKEEYEKYSELSVLSTKKWEEAKKENNFDIYKDYLKEMIETNKRFIKYRGYEGNPYNVLLDDYEPEMLVDDIDKFFYDVREKLSPFIKKIVEKRKNEKNEIKEIFETLKYDINKQKELSKYVLDIIKFDFNRGVLKESEHPFTSGTDKNNVRITTHYYENNLLSALYSTIHEGGHALYEQNICDCIATTILGTGVSMGIHESQSRIYENMFGRSKEFLSFIYPKIDEMFELSAKGIDENKFYKLANEVEESLIRVEADELTYPIHILIRYELEKEIFEKVDEVVNVDELSKKWDEKYEKYLGIKPSNYSEGILQDVHWSCGLFGYFPSYALGSAYAAQIYNAINKQININEEMKKGDFTKINEILKENIHKFGKMKTPKQLIENMTGEKFNSQYYVDYLINKFSEVYEI